MSIDTVNLICLAVGGLAAWIYQRRAGTPAKPTPPPAPTPGLVTPMPSTGNPLIDAVLRFLAGRVEDRIHTAMHGVSKEILPDPEKSEGGSAPR